MAADWAKVKRRLSTIREMSNVRGVVYFAQRRFRGPSTRRHIAQFVARFLPRPTAVDAGRLSGELEQQGFAMLDGLVTPTMVEDMHRYFRAQKVTATYIPGSPAVSIDDPNLPDCHTFQVPDRAVAACPHVLDVANDPRVLAIASAHFGCKPTIGYMSAWWSVPTADGVPRQAENFHRDFDDVDFLKLFVYLSDVEVENGPHEFIRGSHAAPQLRQIRRHTDQEVIEAFGKERLVTFTGKAGIAFMENTTGLHRGLAVRAGKRLVLQVVYSMLPMAYGPPAPYSRSILPTPARPLDSYINRIYVENA
jgi:hypothetical protein